MHINKYVRQCSETEPLGGRGELGKDIRQAGIQDSVLSGGGHGGGLA